LPAAMHSYYLRNMYLENNLVKPGYLTLGGVKIDLRKVKVPCYFISTVEDHIAPWKSTYMGARLPTGATKFVLGGSGHIAGIVNPPVANKYGYWTNDATDGNLPEDPQEFLAGATQNPGSWWTHWSEWMNSLPGGSAKVKARNPEDGPLAVIEPAPGSYVKFRLDAQKKK
jgi:polyhydroxyalkanoate synthase